MGERFKILVLIGLIIYVISPIDAVPGPIDDVILCVVYMLANRGSRSVQKMGEY